MHASIARLVISRVPEEIADDMTCGAIAIVAELHDGRHYGHPHTFYYQQMDEALELYSKIALSDHLDLNVWELWKDNSPDQSSDDIPF